MTPAAGGGGGLPWRASYVVFAAVVASTAGVRGQEAPTQGNAARAGGGFDNATATATGAPPNPATRRRVEDEGYMAANVAGVVSAVGSAITGSPGMVVATGRLMLVSNIECTGDAEPAVAVGTRTPRPLSLYWSFHPLDSGIGPLTNPHRWYVGAVVFNIVLASVCVLVGAVFINVEACLLSRAPLVLPALWLLPGTTYAAARLIIAPGSAAVEVFTGLVGLMSIAALPATVWRKVVGWHVFRAATVADPHARKSTVYRVVFGGDAWVSLSESARFVQQHGVCFQAYRYGMQRFLILELFLTILLGILAAWRPLGDGDSACWAREIIVLAVLTGYTAVVFHARPYLSPVNNVVDGVVAVLCITVVALRRVPSATGGAADTPAALTLMVTSNGVTLKVLWDVAVFFIAGRRRAALALRRGGDYATACDTHDVASSVEELEQDQGEHHVEGDNGDADATTTCTAIHTEHASPLLSRGPSSMSRGNGNGNGNSSHSQALTPHISLDAAHATPEMMLPLMNAASPRSAREVEACLAEMGCYVDAVGAVKSPRDVGRRLTDVSDLAATLNNSARSLQQADSGGGGDGGGGVRRISSSMGGGGDYLAASAHLRRPLDAVRSQSASSLLMMMPPLPRSPGDAGGLVCDDLASPNLVPLAANSCLVAPVGAGAGGGASDTSLLSGASHQRLQPPGRDGGSSSNLPQALNGAASGGSGSSQSMRVDRSLGQAPVSAADHPLQPARWQIMRMQSISPPPGVGGGAGAGAAADLLHGQKIAAPRRRVRQPSAVGGKELSLAGKDAGEAAGGGREKETTGGGGDDLSVSMASLPTSLHPSALAHLAHTPNGSPLLTKSSSRLHMTRRSTAGPLEVLRGVSMLKLRPCPPGGDVATPLVTGMSPATGTTPLSATQLPAADPTRRRAQQSGLEALSPCLEFSSPIWPGATGRGDDTPCAPTTASQPPPADNDNDSAGSPQLRMHRTASACTASERRHGPRAGSCSHEREAGAGQGPPLNRSTTFKLDPGTGGAAGRLRKQRGLSQANMQRPSVFESAPPTRRNKAFTFVTPSASPLRGEEPHSPASPMPPLPPRSAVNALLQNGGGGGGTSSPTPPPPPLGTGPFSPLTPGLDVLGGTPTTTALLGASILGADAPASRIAQRRSTLTAPRSSSASAANYVAAAAAVARRESSSPSTSSPQPSSGAPSPVPPVAPAAGGGDPLIPRPPTKSDSGADGGADAF